MIWLNNIIRSWNMNKSLIVFVTLICTLSAFTIFKGKKETSLQAIPWPFTICGNGQWTIEKLSLAAQPVRNANNDIDVVKFYLFSLELPVTILSSPALTLMSSWTESSSTQNLLTLKRAITKMTLSSSNTKTSSPASLPLELTASLSLSRTMERIMDAWPSTSSFDSPIPHSNQ